MKIFPFRFKMFTFLLCNFLAISTLAGFNLDTKFPKIFSRPVGEYFGFSVALHKNSKGPMALVGAPLANSSFLRNQLHQPGALFSCELENSNCQEIKLEAKGNEPIKKQHMRSTYDLKDNMWLGVSLDVQYHSRQRDIITCAHLRKNEMNAANNHKYHLANGACYVINSELDSRSVKMLMPLPNKQKEVLDSALLDYNAVAQVGTSATYSEDGKHLFLGAPGFYGWSGTVVSYSSDLTRFRYENPVIPNSPEKSSLLPYAGYSVTSGKFYEDNDFYVATGAPREASCHGRVYIFQSPQVSTSKIQVHQQEEGSQLGEYFGAALLAVDLNNDHLTDLLVGAPFASTGTGGDEGKVYVYLSNGKVLQEHKQIRGGNVPNSRFGTAIANVGDLNRDGFNDIAVGAPYEGRGAIYIYHGSNKGIKAKFVQKIVATQISPSLSGFGIHISRGLDIDDNHYPDILVGAYFSSEAVLFRAQPVVEVFPKISFNPKQINTNITACEYKGESISCLNVTICLKYRGKDLPLTLGFENKIFADDTKQNLISHRGFFLQNGQRTSVFSQKLQLKHNENLCFTNEMFLDRDTKDLITPIQISYEYTLSETKKNTDVFTKSFPVINPSSQRSITSPITFQTGCGSDDKCHTDLVVTAEFPKNLKNNPLVIGKDNKLEVSIKVTNEKEPAYLSELFIYFPSEMNIINKDFCSVASDQQNQRSNSCLICELGNPFKRGKEVGIQIKLDVSQIPTDQEEMYIYFETKTTSIEINPEDNSLKIPIHFQVVSDISIEGNPNPEQVAYDGKRVKDTSISLSHTYYVWNYGPSPFNVADIKLFFPTSFLGKNGLVNFLSEFSVKADSGRSVTIPAYCNVTYLQSKLAVSGTKPRRNESTINELKVPNIYDSNKEITTQPDTSDKSSSIEEDIVSSHSDKKTTVTKRKDFVVNCKTSTCEEIHCYASPFLDTKKVARITVSFLIDGSIFDEFLDQWSLVKYVTEGHVSIRGEKDIQPAKNHPDKKEISTVIVHSGPPAPEEIDQWIIFVSIGVGVLLLLLILVLLIRFGFFKRKQKEKLKLMVAGTEGKDNECESFGEVESKDEALG